MTKKEIEECGWSISKDMTHSGDGYTANIEIENSEDFWELQYDPETNKTTIEKWIKIGHMSYNTHTILECKVHDKKELLQEMQWCEIPIPQ